ncbi:hypothetical protein B296_00014520, partial [Ensete ventricosum]
LDLGKSLGVGSPLRLITTGDPFETIKSEHPLEMVETDSSLKLVGIESLLEVIRTESPLKVIETESPLEVVGTESPLQVVGTESPLGVVPTESSLEAIRTESPLKMVRTESPLEVIGTKSQLEVLAEGCHGLSKLPTREVLSFLVEVVGEHLAHGDEKRPGGGGSEPRKKKMKVMVSKPPKRIVPKGTSEKAHHDKGKEPVEVAKSLDRPPTVRDLCKVDDQAGKDRYFIAQISELSCLELVCHPFLCSYLPFCPWQGLHFVGALIDHVHDMGRVVHLLTERNSTLRTENKELKASSGLEAMTAVERWAIKLSAEVEWLKTALGEF